MLPGVAVSLGHTDRQAITGVTGHYQLRCPPGRLELDFAKTGYTPAHLRLDAQKARTTDAAPVRLWPLPPGKGVYLFEEDPAAPGIGERYRESTRTEPKPYEVKEAEGTLPPGTPVHATKIRPELETFHTQPLLIAHKLPPYDARLCRLEAVEATPTHTQAGGYTETVWAPVTTLALLAIPIDEPQRLLLELRPMAPLEPGIYAVHWGAFDGHPTTDPRGFLFQVVDPNAPPEAEPEAEEDTEEGETAPDADKQSAE